VCDCLRARAKTSGVSDVGFAQYPPTTNAHRSFMVCVVISKSFESYQPPLFAFFAMSGDQSQHKGQANQANDEHTPVCSVCLGAFHHQMKTQCSHLYCQGCLELWMQAHAQSAVTCPLCRAPLRREGETVAATATAATATSRNGQYFRTLLGTGEVVLTSSQMTHAQACEDDLHICKNISRRFFASLAVPAAARLGRVV
jgi:hypothetical protein